MKLDPSKQIPSSFEVVAGPGPEKQTPQPAPRLGIGLQLVKYCFDMFVGAELERELRREARCAARELRTTERKARAQRRRR